KWSSIVRILYLNINESKLKEEHLDRISRALGHSKYWFTESTQWNTEIIYTENHQILCHSAEYLIGQLFPNATFPYSGMTGQDHIEHAKFLINRWLDRRAQFGFSEWNSNSYLPVDITALANLIEFALDEEIAKKAAMILDTIAFTFANNYFNANGQELNLTEKEKEELRPIDKALEIISGYINNEVENRKEFAKYIFNNVLFVATKMPGDIDENKVFEAMNNRGIQLQQHEILKSRLLKSISDNAHRHKLGLLWDACSMMNDYLERNIKTVANLQWENLFSISDNDEEKDDVELPKDILSRLGKNENTEKKKLLDILDKDISEDDKKRLAEISEKKEKDDQYDSGKVRSIITFPMLLLHTLRIYQYRFLRERIIENGVEVKGKELINVFKPFMEQFSQSEAVENFILLLWEVRKQFDCFVIKWVSDEEGNDETHLIKRLYQNKNSFQRRAVTTNEGFALLQSMLYHSQQIITFYWLTPFLNKMLDNPDADELFAYLEKLDDYMFCSNRKADLRSLSYKAMMKKDNELAGDQSYVQKELKAQRGTSYPSYWFYKLEYLLWKNRSIFSKQEVWEDYKMTAKNSIEHISPQNPKPEDSNMVFSAYDSEEEKRNKQNDFGNLVLLSPGMNSEYSNKSFQSKKVEHKEKMQLKHLYSLKSDLIFDYDEWNWENCEKHKEEMIAVFDAHLKNKQLSFSD
ncbi:MAG: GmrSD restriction endonuclease domain-containing protein, partial [bacterium]